MKTVITTKKILKYLCLCIFCALMFANPLKSQNVGINATGASPHNSTILDLNTGNTYTSPNGRGLLPPNVALTGTGDITTVTSAATSLLVYNTATAGAGATAVVPGFYYWNGVKWLALVTNASAWSTVGNVGTVDGTNFIGTTDNVPFNIKVNNQKAGRIDPTASTTGYGYQSLNALTSGGFNTANGYRALYSNTIGEYNTAIGYRTLYLTTSGSYNTAVGSVALQNNTTGGLNTAVGQNSMQLNISGDDNTAIGYGSLQNNTTGPENTAIGNRALQANTIGYCNTAIGKYALYSTTSGYYNVAAGYSSLRLNTTGYINIAVGYKALYSNVIGAGNTAIGYQALYNNTVSDNLAIGYNTMFFNTTGTLNTAIGTQALNQNTTGNTNVAVGMFALNGNTTGSQNTAVGEAAFSAAGYSNSSAFGYATVISASNQIRLGNASVTSIGGQVGWTTVSDKRFKTNVKETVPGLAFITKLRPVTYNINMDAMAKYLNTPDSLRLKDGEALKANMLQTGFIAQEVEQAANDLGFDFSGVDKPKNDKDYYGLRYADFTVPLVKAVQELNDKNNAQQQVIQLLQKQMVFLQKQIELLKSK